VRANVSDDRRAHRGWAAGGPPTPLDDAPSPGRCRSPARPRFRPRSPSPSSRSAARAARVRGRGRIGLDAEVEIGGPIAWGRRSRRPQLRAQHCRRRWSGPSFPRSSSASRAPSPTAAGASGQLSVTMLEPAGSTSGRSQSVPFYASAADCHQPADNRRLRGRRRLRSIEAELGVRVRASSCRSRGRSRRACATSMVSSSPRRRHDDRIFAGGRPSGRAAPAVCGADPRPLQGRGTQLISEDELLDGLDRIDQGTFDPATLEALAGYRSSASPRSMRRPARWPPHRRRPSATRRRRVWRQRCPPSR
jgi:hypothetical protein